MSWWFLKTNLKLGARRRNVYVCVCGGRLFWNNWIHKHTFYFRDREGKKATPANGKLHFFSFHFSFKFKTHYIMKFQQESAILTQCSCWKWEKRITSSCCCILLSSKRKSSLVSSTIPFSMRWSVGILVCINYAVVKVQLCSVNVTHVESSQSFISV